MIPVAGPGWSDDAAEDVRAHPERVSQAVEKLRVVPIPRAARRPVFEDRDGKGPSHPSRHLFGAFFAAALAVRVALPKT